MPEVTCPNCGTRLNAPDDLIGSQVTCGQCQQVFVASLGAAPQGPSLPYTSPGPTAPPPVPGLMPPQAQTSGLATASLVLGIASIPVCMCYGVPAIICGILAIVFAVLARKAVAESRAAGNSLAFAKAGMICGIFGIILPLIFWPLFFYVILRQGSF